jgi:8-oxo-dGTP pyrophosphatase MutT (NUDIX family)
MEQRHILSPGRGAVGRPGLTRDAIRARLSAEPIGTRGYAGDGNEQRVRGDHTLLAGSEPSLHPLTPAAVLVPLVERAGGFTVLLTQRTAHLTAHAGQISFPGGRIEATDRDPIDAALRETEEEVGLPRGHVETIGRLDTYVTGTGFTITPIVGFISAPYPMKPDPFEVAEVFEVPLSFVLDPRNHQTQSREAKGRVRTFFVLPYEHRYIWGATAGMLVNLAELLGSTG